MVPTKAFSSTEICFCKTATSFWQCFTPIHSLKLRRGYSYPCESRRVKKHELSVRSDAPTSIVQLPSLEATSNKLAQGALQRDFLHPLPLCSMPHPLISRHSLPPTATPSNLSTPRFLTKLFEGNFRPPLTNSSFYLYTGLFEIIVGVL